MAHFSKREKPKKRTLTHVAESIHKGGLHESLGIPQGEKIPAGDLEAKPSDSTKVKRQKALARTFAAHRP
jgi:hypothetical protein